MAGICPMKKKGWSVRRRRPRCRPSGKKQSEQPAQGRQINGRSVGQMDVPSETEVFQEAKNKVCVPQQPESQSEHDRRDPPKPLTANAKQGIERDE